ncbi:hypothetical protein ACFC09_05790 [Streptomyces sp. NPDC056161]|uniref:hypothetical protein n=1 Tax=Streptomyces sp. NPDC056161 TaxID=3345732 RepID=UPI0035DD2F76
MSSSRSSAACPRIRRRLAAAYSGPRQALLLQQGSPVPGHVRRGSGPRRIRTAAWLPAGVTGGSTDLYFEFHVATYGRRCSAVHDPLAAAVAVGGVVPTLAPVVDVLVDATDGPGRGQTICDLRGQYLGYPAQPGAHCRVVLEAGPDTAAHLMKRLLTL